MGFDYENLPKCDGCVVPEKIGSTKLECALYWRPGTGTKAGFPDKNGNECPRDVLERRG